ncbi:DUF7638 domain-containing protein [Nonlabens ulvanivorans]|uniref:DUF7638 domain-containing protein n=1 Tax=Nonlabens ulvanivorans TaxID=906888 RepID=UPI002942A1B1|nr:hypothetical protein [Nonlabens ulvanivorans]WOI21915.1 hypothetical protein R1T42_09550 [Nonlabens ulvanivorans]
MISLGTKFYKNSNENKINGEYFKGVGTIGNNYFTYLIVFANSMIKCHKVMSFSVFKEKLLSGLIQINLPSSCKVHFSDSTRYKLNDDYLEETNEDFIKIVEDSIIELNGGKGRCNKCIELFKSYLLNDTEQNYFNLKSQFEDLPSTKKVLFEMVDYKDPLIALMKTGEKFSPEGRKHMLIDYFEDEWNEKDFK